MIGLKTLCLPGKDSLLFWAAFLCEIVTACGLLCSRCTTVDDASCIDNPPPATTCYSTQPGTHCSLIRYYDVKGDLVDVIRDCATVHQEERCEDHDVAVAGPSSAEVSRTCIRTCDTDGCNTAFSFLFNSNKLLVMFAGLASLLLSTAITAFPRWAI